MNDDTFLNELRRWLHDTYATFTLTDGERAVLWRLPEGTKARPGVIIEPFNCRHKLHIGKDVFLGSYVMLDCTTDIHIGDGTHLAAYASVWTHSQAFMVTGLMHGKEIIKPVRIGTKSWLGAGVVVYPGVTIGDHVIVFPNSVVNRNLPDNSIWAGNPVQRRDRVRK